MVEDVLTSTLCAWWGLYSTLKGATHAAHRVTKVNPVLETRALTTKPYPGTSFFVNVLHIPATCEQTSNAFLLEVPPIDKPFHPWQQKNAIGTKRCVLWVLVGTEERNTSDKISKTMDWTSISIRPQLNSLVTLLFWDEISSGKFQNGQLPFPIKRAAKGKSGWISSWNVILCLEGTEEGRC